VFSTQSEKIVNRISVGVCGSKNMKLTGKRLPFGLVKEKLNKRCNVSIFKTFEFALEISGQLSDGTNNLDLVFDVRRTDDLRFVIINRLFGWQ